MIAAARSKSTIATAACVRNRTTEIESAIFRVFCFTNKIQWDPSELIASIAMTLEMVQERVVLSKGFSILKKREEKKK